MKVTVCELHSAPGLLDQQWQRLVDHVTEVQSELLLLPEMPFYPWLCGTREYQATEWQAAEQAHQVWLEVMNTLPCAVAGTRPVTENGGRFNRGFTVEKNQYTDVHTKYHLPDEDGFWEAVWYQSGDGAFRTFSAAQATCGMLICTDVWFLERARRYGRANAHIILNPRANYDGVEDRAIWQAATKVAAFSGGAWVLTSNLLPSDADESAAAQGWIMSPDGEVVAHTTAEQPFITFDIDLDAAVQAKKRYPCYVNE